MTDHDDLRARLLAEAIEYHRHQASGTPDQYGNRPVKPNIALESWHTNVADMLSARPAGETVWQMRVTGGSWHDCSHDDVVRAANCAAIEARVLYTIPQPAPAALVEALREARILTCVYCGHEYPQDTPAAGDKVLTDHIRTCTSHPLRVAEATIQQLRSALIGLVGVSEPGELRQMEAAMRSLPAPDEDKAVTINAIHALLATASKESE